MCVRVCVCVRVQCTHTCFLLFPPLPACRHLEELDVLGKQAKRAVVHYNMRLVVSVAKRFISSGMPFHDLIEEGVQVWRKEGARKRSRQAGLAGCGLEN